MSNPILEALMVDPRPVAKGTKYKDYPDSALLTDLESAADEIDREIKLRKTIFDRWVEDGRISAGDAHRRLMAMITAHYICMGVIDYLVPNR